MSLFGKMLRRKRIEICSTNKLIFRWEKITQKLESTKCTIDQYLVLRKTNLSAHVNFDPSTV